MSTTGATTMQPDLISELADTLHGSASFMDSLERWTGHDLELSSPCRTPHVQLDGKQAVQLEASRDRSLNPLCEADVDALREALHRSCFVRSSRTGDVVAEIESTIMTRRLPEVARTTLDSTTQPLGRVLETFGGARNTIGTQRMASGTAVTNDPDMPVLTVTARMDLPNWPLALVRETVLSNALRLRTAE